MHHVWIALYIFQSNWLSSGAAQLGQGLGGLALHLKHWRPSFGASVSPFETLRKSLSFDLLLEYEIWPLFPKPRPLCSNLYSP